MINKNWIKADLRISSLEFTPSEITNILSKEPTESAEKGRLMSPKNPKSQRIERNGWFLSSGLPDNASLEKHLDILLEFIASKQMEFNKLEKKCDIDIFCGLSIKGGQGTFSLSADLMKKLSFFPLEVIFDLYVEED